MYIYLDETFNLKKGSKNQFLAIAGFSTNNPKQISKLFDRIKKSSLPKKLSGREIKSANILAEKLIKPKLFPALLNFDIEIYCCTQQKNLLSNIYFPKQKLNYDKLYLDLLSDLLVNQWHYRDQKIIILTLDTFKTKKINKQKISQTLMISLKEKYPKINFQINFVSSAGELNLQLADFICGIFYDRVLQNEKWFKIVKSKVIKNKLNPLN